MQLYPFSINYQLIYTDEESMVVDWTSYDKSDIKSLEGTFKVNHDEVVYLYNSTKNKENKELVSKWVYSQFYPAANQTKEEGFELKAGVGLFIEFTGEDESTVTVYKGELTFH